MWLDDESKYLYVAAIFVFKFVSVMTDNYHWACGTDFYLSTMVSSVSVI